LWRNYAWEEVASLEGWHKNPALVLEFYNERRAAAWKAKPNAAHSAIGRLENFYDVVVITQNVDELHERGGSKHVVHVHGNLAYARSTRDPDVRIRIDGNPITLGQFGEDNCQLRPDVVWFGEEVRHLDESQMHVATADIVLVVGTSLAVFPFASLVYLARKDAEKYLISLEVQAIPPGFKYLKGSAVTIVPVLVDQWIHAVESA
jgi:NAD-dependent deacetylase